MKTVKEVSEITGVSIRTLRYYDEIGLLKPTELTQAGYPYFGMYVKRKPGGTGEKIREYGKLQRVFGFWIWQKNIYRAKSLPN